MGNGSGPSNQQNDHIQQGTSDFVIADPHVVYYDAVMHSPWNHDGGGHLPQREDWCTYRYTVKDLVLGIATHRFNKNTRRLEVRGYFVGEHPLFKELEPTKAMMIVLSCQSYQSGGSLDIFFEHGIPFDFRQLIEQSLGIVLSGHDQLVPSELGSKVLAHLSNFSLEMQGRIVAQDVNIDSVCFNTYRGTWLPNHILSLIQSNIPLKWIFKQRPGPLTCPLVFIHLLNHLQAALTEEYAIRRLEDRQMGESLGNLIRRVDAPHGTYYASNTDLDISDAETAIRIPGQTPFCLIPVVPITVKSIFSGLDADLSRARSVAAIGQPVIVVPMDFIYLNEELQQEYRRIAAERGVQLIVVGMTSSQLRFEAELNLSITAAQADSDEVDAINVDRYPD